MTKQYQCFYLNHDYRLGHDDNAKVLFESDNLGEVCSFAHLDWITNKRDIAVYQPSIQVYRQVNQNKRRNTKGKFSKFEDSVH